MMVYYLMAIMFGFSLIMSQSYFHVPALIKLFEQRDGKVTRHLRYRTVTVPRASIKSEALPSLRKNNTRVTLRFSPYYENENIFWDNGEVVWDLIEDRNNNTVSNITMQTHSIIHSIVEW